jgi:matrixin
MIPVPRRLASSSGPFLAVLLAFAWTPGPVHADPIAGWPQPGGRSTPVAITYSYSNLLDGSFLSITPAELRAATEEALQLWARYAPLDFIEEPDSGPPPSDVAYDASGVPQIRIGHETMTQIAHAFFPTAGSGLAGDVHLDSGVPWTIGAGHWNVLEALVHELGHALGLQHEVNEIAMMNPAYPTMRYDGLGSAFLFPADIAAIQALYGTGVGAVQPLSPTPEPATALLVGGAFLCAASARARRRLHCLVPHRPSIFTRRHA